jgi:hypothetical protein
MIPIPTALMKSSEHASPKTAFAFFGSVIAIITSGTAAVTIGLAASDHAGMAIAALVGGVLILGAILLWVIHTFGKDPTRFVVGPITGTEFLKILQWTAGDSTTGEYIAEDAVIEGPPPRHLPDSGTQALGRGTDAESASSSEGPE